ncbi:MAG: chemotaxis protein CheA [Anaerolineae bacterium]|nr:chemotaxis protein CheA [Anaerolineae bacterium]
MTPASTNVFTEFLDDYFAECDEHLTAMRRNLLTLESLAQQERVDVSLLDELFRSLHTIKGLSGMVGLAEAEQLAHLMESILRALRRHQLDLSDEAVDALILGTRTLEQVIATRQTRQPLPDIAPAIKQLEAITGPLPDLPPSPEETPTAATETRLPLPRESGPPAFTLREGERAWLFQFTPARALAERGISVDSIRTRLQEIGQIVHAAPRIQDGGKVTFEFLVTTDADDSTFTPWQEDGLTWAPYEPPPPTPAATGLKAVPTPSIGPPNVVRVDLTRVDDLMQTIGDLVISRARLEDTLTSLARHVPAAQQRQLQEINQALERQLRSLREGVMRLRMVPLGEIFERMKFVVRDLARERRQEINLALSGQETEIDKLVVERMLDPLLHLVRNAVSHGLEPAEERLAQGKPAEGTIALRAATAGDSVIIEIEDDGRGIDRERVAEQARAQGLLDAEAPLDDPTLLDILCTTGFSTRRQADRASGRGVGLDVVKKTVEELGGSLALDTEVGRGTRFTIRLPLTLAIVDALIVSVGGQRFAVPLPSVREVIEARPKDVTVLGNEDEMLSYHGDVLPLIRLAARFGLQEQFERAFYVLVAAHGAKAAGIVVDRILGQREIVVRAISDPLIQVPGIAGATELGDGRPLLIINPAVLIGSRR